VLTVNLQDRPGTPTKVAAERVIEFFRQRTAAPWYQSALRSRPNQVF